MKWVWVFFLFPWVCQAAPIATCQSDGTFLRFQQSANTSAFLTDPNDVSTLIPMAIIITDIQAIKAIPNQYRKCVDHDVDGRMDAVVEMTQAEKDAADAPRITEMVRQLRLRGEVRGALIGGQPLNAEQADWLLDRR